MRTSIGGYTPLRIDHTVINASPKPVQQLWGKVTAAQKRYHDARDVLAVLQQQVKEAPAVDAAAAREAVVAGQPLPQPTVNAAQQAVTDQEREISALIDFCDDTEANFLAALNAHRDGMRDGFRTHAERELQDAITAINTAQEAVERFTMSASLWNWARSDDTSTPPQKGFVIPVHGGNNVEGLLQTAIEALHREHPEEIERKETAYKNELAALARHSTPDGLVIDAASIGAYTG